MCEHRQSDGMDVDDQGLVAPPPTTKVMEQASFMWLISILLF